MRAYVISLEKRPDRWSAFMKHMHSHQLNRIFELTLVHGVDGEKLNLDSLRHRVSPQNLAQIDHLRGHLGCNLSHLECWHQIANDKEIAVVFEDDARLLDGIDAKMVQVALNGLPKDADLVWLNDYNFWARESVKVKVFRKLSHLLDNRLSRRSVSFTQMPDVLTTAEAYIITQNFAQKLYDGISNTLGANDRQMQLFIHKLPQSNYKIYQSNPALFTQADRTDSATLIKTKTLKLIE
ncbi:hypothetical protein CKO12_04465 [Chromatium okenii]|uniref:glycosyltransferase family 25 protein n=1 Tax=Chromatium okenii TaxID=61644 RepID=UPI001908C031|nr:glycosyltransferase family 25 protein [Chromatium okenii]MBK1641137.1 hypothetical protein [Chromatium okenii]